MVREIMSGTANRLAQREGVSPHEIFLMIHGRGDKANLAIKYYYCVKKAPKLNDEGGIAYLKFANDILGKKMDVMAKGAMAGHFLTNYISTKQKEYGSESIENIDICLMPKDYQANEFEVLIMENRSVKEKTTLAAVFPN